VGVGSIGVGSDYFGWIITDIYRQIFICFGWITTTMGRPKVEQRKIKTGITLDPELYNWVQEKVKTKEFSSMTHAIERGLVLLRQKMESKR